MMPRKRWKFLDKSSVQRERKKGAESDRGREKKEEGDVCRIVFHLCVVDVLIDSVRFSFCRQHGVFHADSAEWVANDTAGHQNMEIMWAHAHWSCSTLVFSSLLRHEGEKRHWEWYWECGSSIKPLFWEVYIYILLNLLIYFYILRTRIHLKISSVWKMGRNKCECLFPHKFKSPNLYFYIHVMRYILLKTNKKIME